MMGAVLAVNSMKSAFINNCSKIIQSMVFPSQCVLCGAEATEEYDLCRACRTELPYLSITCQCCALPLQMAGTCGRCLQHVPSFDRAYGIFHYAQPLDFLIQRLKFNKKLSYARLLGSLMAEELFKRYVAAAQPLPGVIIPVPLHTSRLRERGYNQALEIARPIARRLEIPIDHRCAARTRETATQSELPAKFRRHNVKGAFKITGLQANHVAIIDDVMTTGHTVEEFASEVRRAGVKKIDIWTCARASMARA